MKMRISTDGGFTWTDAPDGVQVTLDPIDVPGEDGPGLLNFNFTSEGRITDIYVSREYDLDHNLATASVLYADLMSDLIEESA